MALNDYSRNGEYLKIGIAAKLCGNISTSYLRKLSNLGRIPCYRLLNDKSERRYLLSDINRFLGIPEQKESVNSTKAICLYARVSSVSQATNSSGENALTRQVEMLRTYINKEYKNPNIYECVRCASGLTHFDEQWNKFLVKLLNGNFSHVIAKDLSRTSRSCNEILASICKHTKTKLVYVQEVDAVDEKTKLVNDLINYITVYANRLSSAKASQVTKLTMTQEQLEFCMTLYQQSYSVKYITKQMEEKGFVDSKGVPFKAPVVNRRIKESLPLMSQLNKTNVIPKGSFQEWFSLYIRKIDGKDRIKFSSIETAYKNWCSDNGHDPIKQTAISKHLQKEEIKRVRGRSCVYFTGITMKKRRKEH